MLTGISLLAVKSLFDESYLYFTTQNLYTVQHVGNPVLSKIFISYLRNTDKKKI
jgi:hypothetical protein